MQVGREPTAAHIAECDEEDPFDPRCRLVRYENVTVWKMPPWRLLAGVAAVPILLLILGATGYWVAKGFRASN